MAYEYSAELVDLVRGLEQRALERAAEYDIACEHSTHTTWDHVTETLTISWSLRGTS